MFLFCIKTEWFGIKDESFAPRYHFLVGLWWIGFAQITFTIYQKQTCWSKQESKYFYQWFKELKKVWLQVKHLPC
jgi:UMF1 family MFS transporter